MLRKAAILFHPRRKQAIVEAEWLACALAERDVQTKVGNAWDPEMATSLCGETELVVALGGDGTIIHAARLASPFEVPLLGINLGRVGFLAEMTPDDLHGRVDDLAESAYWVEERTMLEVDACIDGRRHTYLCLNEVVVARGVAPRAIHVTTMLDGEVLLTYTADAVLVATATGSTAYSLAAGGPILYPESRDFMITPVAPHLHIGRSIVVPADTELRLTLGTDRPAVMSVDGGEEHAMTALDTVDVRRSGQLARFARLGPRQYFYAAIHDRLT